MYQFVSVSWFLKCCWSSHMNKYCVLINSWCPDKTSPNVSSESEQLGLAAREILFLN